MYNLHGGLSQNLSDPNSSISTYHYMYSSGPPVIQNSPYYYSSHNERLSNVGVGNSGEWQNGGGQQQLSQEREAFSKDKVGYRNKPQLLPAKDRVIDKTSFNKSSPHFFPSQQIEGGATIISSSNLINIGATGSQTSIKDNEKISQIQKIYNNNVRSRHNLHKSQNNFYNTHSNTFFNSVSQSLNSNANGSLDMRQKKTRQNTNRISQSPSTDTQSLQQQQQQQQQQQSTQQLSQLPMQQYPQQQGGSKRAQQLVKTAKQLSPPLASFQKENSNLAGLHSKEFKSRSSMTVGKKEILITSAASKQPLKAYLQAKPTQQSSPPSAFFSSNGSSSTSASKFYQTEPNFHKQSSSKKLFPYSNQPAIKAQLIPIEDLIVNENMASSGQIGRKYFTSSNTQPLSGSSFFSVPPKSNSFFSTSASKLAALNPKVNDKPKKIESIPQNNNTNSFQRNLLSNEFQQLQKSKTSEVAKRAQITSQSNDEEKKIPRQLASLETQQLYNYDVEMDEPLLSMKVQQDDNQNIIQNDKKDEKNNLSMKDRRNNTNNSLSAVGLEVILEHHKEDEVREVPLDLIQQVQKISEARPKTSEGGRRRRKLRQAIQDKDEKKQKDTFDCFRGDNNFDTQQRQEGQDQEIINKIDLSKQEINQEKQQNIQEEQKEQGQLKGSPKRLDFSPLKTQDERQAEMKDINVEEDQYSDDFHDNNNNNNNNIDDQEYQYNEYGDDFEPMQQPKQFFRSQAEFYKPSKENNQNITSYSLSKSNSNIFRKTTNEGGFNSSGNSKNIFNSTSKNSINNKQQKEDNNTKKQGDLPIEVHVQEDDNEYIYQETENKKKTIIPNKKTIDSSDGYKIIIRHNKSAAGLKRVQKDKDKQINSGQIIQKNNQDTQNINNNSITQNQEQEVPPHEAQDDVIERVVVPFKTALDSEFINLFAAAQQFQ